MRQKTATQNIAEILIKQAFDKDFQTSAWFIISILMFIGQKKSIKLIDFLRIIRDTNPLIQEIIDEQNSKEFRAEI